MMKIQTFVFSIICFFLCATSLSAQQSAEELKVVNEKLTLEVEKITTSGQNIESKFSFLIKIIK